MSSPAKSKRPDGIESAIAHRRLEPKSRNSTNYAEKLSDFAKSQPAISPGDLSERDAEIKDVDLASYLDENSSLKKRHIQIKTNKLKVDSVPAMASPVSAQTSHLNLE